MVEINEAERKKEKRIERNGDNLGDLWDNVKWPNIRIVGVLEEEDKKKGHEKILEEITVENFPKMGRAIATQVQETQRVPNRINPRWNIPRHILIKLMKIKHKEQILKAAREKQQITHNEIPIRITADLSIETLQARKERQDILIEMREKNLQPRLFYPARISFRIQIWRRNQKLYRQAKVERIQHHQSNSSTNAKGCSLDKKQKRFIKMNPKQQWDHTYQ